MDRVRGKCSWLGTEGVDDIQPSQIGIHLDRQQGAAITSVIVVQPNLRAVSS